MFFNQISRSARAQQHITTVMTLACSAVLALCARDAFSFAQRVTQVPNNQWGCALCHQSASGGGARTAFGEDVKMFGTDGVNVNWSGVCDKDSDGDGVTNGAELGDPDCAWANGDPNPDAMVTDPNDPESFNMPTAAGEMVEAGEMAEAGEPAEAGEMAEAGEPAEAGEMAEAGEPAEAGEMAEAGEPADTASAESDEGGCYSARSRAPLWILLVLFLARGVRRRALA